MRKIDLREVNSLRDLEAAPMREALDTNKGITAFELAAVKAALESPGDYSKAELASLMERVTILCLEAEQRTSKLHKAAALCKKVFRRWRGNMAKHKVSI